MGRGQKLGTGEGQASRKTRKTALSKASPKRLKAVNMVVRAGMVLERGDISRDSVSTHALATFGSPEKAQHWMSRPNPLFQGKTPAQVIEFDVVGVEAELVRIDHGVYM
jgi:uncharacterized protein (DUF2384 family)